MVVGKLNVMVLYGGRSTEHEVACRSAAFVLRNLDRSKYTVHAIAIDKDGVWLPQNVERLLAAGSGPVPILRAVDGNTAAPVAPGSFGLDQRNLVVFPVLHGSFGEDGTMQGLLELGETAFIGPDTLGSAIGMDKVVSKRLAQAAGVPVVPWLDIRAQHWPEQGEALCARAVASFGLPLFVKPARLGSSVGVAKVKRPEDLAAACREALSFDDRIMIEKGLDVREIEIAMLGDYTPQASVAGEVIPHAEFYSYDAKYIDTNGASMAIPAALTPLELAKAQDLARRTFSALELYGMARIDLFLEKSTGDFYLNEVNTIPGFTEISQYPLLWQESGIAPARLLDLLIDTARRRWQTKQALRRSR